MSAQQQSLGPINPCTCPDRVENQLYRERYIEHPAVPLVHDPKCKRCFPGWVARWIVADDPNPEYSRLDRMDGLGEPLPEYEPSMPVWLQMILCGVILAVMFGAGVWILL